MRLLSAVISMVRLPALNATQVVCLACCANGFLDRVIQDLRGPEPTIMLGLSPFELLIAFVAVRELGGARERAGLPHFALALLLLAPSGAIAWIGLAAFGAFLAVRARGEARFTPLLLVGLAVGQLWATIGFKAFADPLLAADAQITALGLAAFGIAASVAGNVVNAPDGNSIIVLITCATFHKMPLAVVAAFALAGPARVIRLAEIGAIVVVGLALMNFGRLVLMGFSPGVYVFMHDGTGAQLFEAAQTVLIFLAAMRVRP